MPEACQAVIEAAPQLAIEVAMRLERAATLSEQDRAAVLAVARRAALEFATSTRPARRVMSNATEGLRRKIASAGELQSVVRTMKALAAANIGQYENSVRALADYSRTVSLGLGACFRFGEPLSPRRRPPRSRPPGEIGAIVFGSDQGLVGQFNELVADYAVSKLLTLAGKPRVWTVGERVQAGLAAAGFPMASFEVPNSVQGIAPLIGSSWRPSRPIMCTARSRSCTSSLTAPCRAQATDLRICGSCRSMSDGGASSPGNPGRRTRCRRFCSDTITLRALIREYLFISLFRACAESLASENTSRLASMERADRNIEELLDGFKHSFHQLRQSDIDEELFDLVSGVELLRGSRT